jgi:hypothetical protein
MKNRNFRHNKSGQVIVITALMVALVLLTSAIFVIGTEKDVPTDLTDTTSVFSDYQQAARNTLTSALANATNGGTPSVLTTDLDELKSAITSNSYQSILQMNLTSLTDAPYQNGFFISWGSNGQGISSACVVVEIESTGTASTSTSDYLVNVTSAVNLSGSYIELDNSTQVNLTVKVQNEGSPVLAQHLSFYYENSTKAWAKVDSPIVTDFATGTYTASFTTDTAQSFFPLQVSAVCQDQRGIVVVANATCTELE